MTLSAHNLTHTVAERTLYRDLSFESASGELTAVIGPNGCGKSTLLRELVGLRPPQRGEVRLDGVHLTTFNTRERARRIAYLPQTTPLYYDLRVRDVVMLGRAPYLGRLAGPSTDDDQRVQTALQRVELEAFADRGVLTLSGGERQRVMLARMLATGAPTLVLDEPSTALDVGHALAFLDMCRELVSRGRSVVIAMHELELARRYADRVLCLSGSGECHVGTASEVMAPEALETVFNVRVRANEDGISFYSPRDPPPDPDPSHGRLDTDSSDV